MRKSGLGLIGFAALVGLYRAVPRRAPPAVEVAGRAVAAEPAPVAPRAVARPLPPTPAAPAPDLPGQSELRRYHELTARVFASDDEATERRALLHDADLLRAAGARLVLKKTPGAGLGEQQNQALALLLESARAGESAAIAALTLVIKDNGVEDVRLAPEVRRQLAGLKAEALFAWSAGDPAVAARVEAWLPGPVSQRLWQNVLARQRSNEAASLETTNGGKVAR